ncbi:peroxin-3 family [Trichoderma arundinaceum]|uniref:Peroxin-3 family n=1 Tax=Trichoderma arundinaceum TaxID=490622 RepID=A0A395NNP9_TRIAR|nr:peroxin-3 family [Trichoderma arundinaceum]
MLSSARRWLRRNRTPIAIGVGVVGAGYAVTQYVMSKINDARERMSSDRIAKENLRRRFEQNQEDCTFTVLALLPTATGNVITALNTEQITYEIQQIKSSARSLKGIQTTSPPSIADTTLTEDDSKSTISVPVDIGMPFSSSDGPQQDLAPPRPRKTKRQLWDDLTISGRRSYLSSVVALATGSQQATISLENNDDDNPNQTYGSDFDTNRKYLTFSWWLLNKGWVEVMHRVESSVRTVFGSLSPRDLVTFDRVSQLTAEVRKLIEGSGSDERKGSDWLSFLLPPKDREDEVIRESGILDDGGLASEDAAQVSPAALRRLLDETADLIESPAFSHVLTLILDSGFSLLVDKKLATEAFEFSLDEAPTTVATTTSLKRTRAILLPKILSVLTRQAHVIGNGVPNEYLQEMETVRDLEAFSAVVYSSNWENEMKDEGLMESAVYLKSEDTQSQSTQVDSSVVIVDRQASGLEGAWERAVEKRS